MTHGRTPGPCRALMLFATVIAAGCGAFETPVPAGDGTDSPPPEVPLVEYRTLTVDIRSTESVYPDQDSSRPDAPAEPDFLVTPRRGTILYAQFMVVDVPSDVVIRWWLEADGGVLPPGVNLDPQLGLISGIATKSGDFAVTLRAESIGVYDGIRYEARPYRVPIRVRPACLTDGECAVPGYEELQFQCLTDETGKRGGVCTLPTKDPECPTTTERFQVWLQEADPKPTVTELRFAGTVTAHTPCRTSAFSLEAGGEDGWCVQVDLDRPEGATPSEALASVTVTYRVPHNYPAPLTVGARYQFLYGRGSEHAGDHRSDGTLLVFEEGEDQTAPPRLVLLGHTGRKVPHILIEELCAAHGVCPVLPSTEVMPSVCAAESESCGERTRAMLLAKKGDGSVGWAVTGGTPIRLGASDSASPTDEAYALHLALSDMRPGGTAGCAESEDDYRLSYYVLPTSACLLGRAEPVSESSLEAPALLLVEREEGFSPAGREVAFDWEIVRQPFANALFGPALSAHSGVRVRTLEAIVPGLYSIRATARDDAGTPACGIQETVDFAIHPAEPAWIELSHDTPGDLELRVAPLDTPWTVLVGAKSDTFGQVASPANLAPDWGFSWAAEPFFQARASELLEGAGVETFGAPDGLAGRYRVGVLHRGERRAALPATADGAGGPTLARVRVVLNRNVSREHVIQLDVPLAPCQFWEVGVLDLDGLQPGFHPSPHGARSVCGEELDPTGAFDADAALPDDSRRDAREVPPGSFAPSDTLDSLGW